MRNLVIAAGAAAFMLLMPGAASAAQMGSAPHTDISSQEFRIGPDGVRVRPERERVIVRERGWDERRCRRLRAECRYGARGEGNCARYRRNCG